ncbi:MAG: hypothetical protein C0475_07805 [Planctomyces sp.]|nr:hypothetical protein [Planctomyces sp.]MBA4120666.1 hypothetical protein [Isosphaera sp.]
MEHEPLGHEHRPDARAAGRRTPPTAWALAIESSNPSIGASVALSPIDDARAVPLDEPFLPSSPPRCYRQPVAPATASTDDLVPAIDRVLAAASGDQPRTLRAPDVGLIAVSIGPGGYTALRVACAAARGIALCIDALAPAPDRAPLTRRAIPTAIAAAVATVPELPTPVWAGRSVAVALASKGAAALVTIVPGGPLLWAAPCRGRTVRAWDQCVQPAGMTPAALIADSHAPADLLRGAAAAGAAVLPARLDAAVLLRLAAHWRSDPALPIDGTLSPDYGREPEAVTLWRARHGTP